MKKIDIHSSYLLFQRLEELSDADKELLLKARVYCNRSYSPYSKFAVGAAMRLSNNQIIGGANQENASYPLCLCAEQIVLGNYSANHINETIVKLAITVKTNGKDVQSPVSPCGACRQTLLEFEIRQKSPIQIILQGESGPVYVIESIRSLLPLSFDGNGIL